MELIKSLSARITGMITFRKTREGCWAVFGPANEVQLGYVTAHRKDGAQRRVQVDSMSRPFEVNGVPHVFGYLGESKNETQTKPPVETPTQNEVQPDQDQVQDQDPNGFCGW